MHPAPGQPARRTRGALRRRAAGFSLVELLTVILILLILMAAALPLYLDALTDSEEKICRFNMKTLASVEQSYKLHSPTHTYTADMDALVQAGDIYSAPQCPAGGKYRIILGPGTTVDGKYVAPGELAIEDYVVTAHGSFIPGRDSR
jgi:prepilin-type N-terminal cleavage/methylation domain-containing protein